MNGFAEVMKRECVSAFFAVRDFAVNGFAAKDFAVKGLMIPVVISILMIREAVCE